VTSLVPGAAALARFQSGARHRIVNKANIFCALAWVRIKCSLFTKVFCAIIAMILPMVVSNELDIFSMQASLPKTPKAISCANRQKNFGALG